MVEVKQEAKEKSDRLQRQTQNLLLDLATFFPHSISKT
jgi:hypothetical protein